MPSQPDVVYTGGSFGDPWHLAAPGNGRRLARIWRAGRRLCHSGPPERRVDQ